MSTANPDRASIDVKENFGTTRPGSRRSEIQTCKEVGHGNLEQGEEGGASKAQVKCPCLNSSGTAAHQACRAKAPLPHHLTAGTCV